MPGPKPLAINLNDVERQGLELLVHRYTAGHQKVHAGTISKAKDIALLPSSMRGRPDG